MTSYKNSDGTWTVQAAEGKYLYNASLDIYTTEGRTDSSPKMTDWYEVDALPVEVKTDEELFEEFKDEIMSHVVVVRGQQSKDCSSVSYSLLYTPTEIKIIETFKED